MLTIEPTSSFWDCGEFIATSYGFQVGHPPGAPTYALLAHCFMLLAGGNVAFLAWWSNALSALAGGLTVGFLYSSIVMLAAMVWRSDPDRSLSSAIVRMGAAVGALCYLFCDTAWFSATESEVYSLSMLFSATIIWAMLRWQSSTDRSKAPRWFLLVALLLGLSVGVHQLSLLTLPVLLLIYVFGVRERRASLSRRRNRSLLLRVIPLALVFFALGLSTYVIVPIRAAAGTPINYVTSTGIDGFRRYVSRDRYDKAPLWPRSWRMSNDEEHRYALWRGKGGDFQLLVSYQMGYMYLRYLMWNFSGRFNDTQGFGSLQNGQFITGIPFIDRFLVGTSASPPESVAGPSHNVYFMLPLLLGIVGAFWLYGRRRRAFWITLVMFLMGGLVLGIYLNHPVYEPRERDYAYILSFYAFAVWVGFGAVALLDKVARFPRRWPIMVLSLLLLGVPSLMAQQNWDDHNRAHRYVARDAAASMLNSCDRDAILVTYGDNDTFPLWYAQYVEQVRPDVEVLNVNLTGGFRNLQSRLASNSWRRPVYFSHYTFNHYGRFFPSQLRLDGNCYRLFPQTSDSLGVEEFYCHLRDSIRWHPVDNVYLDPISRQFIDQYWFDILKLVNALVSSGDSARAREVLDLTAASLPVSVISNHYLACDVIDAYRLSGDSVTASRLAAARRSELEKCLAYYNTIRRSELRYIKQTVEAAQTCCSRLRDNYSL